MNSYYAVLHMKDGGKFYYAPQGEGFISQLVSEYWRKTGFWLEVYSSFEDMYKDQNKNQFIMPMEDIKRIELVGVRVYPNGDGNPYTVVLL